MHKKLYRFPEALDQLGIGRSRAYDEMAAGRLRYVQYGRTRMFTEEHLDDFVALIAAESDAA